MPRGRGNVWGRKNVRGTKKGDDLQCGETDPEAGCKVLLKYGNGIRKKKSPHSPAAARKTFAHHSIAEPLEKSKKRSESTGQS